MSSICWHCGGEITFRYIDGVLKPLHLNGGCSTSGYVPPPEPVRRAWSESHDDFCRPSKCPYCQEPVFFIRHNGGSVWVDELEWPWPKHGCFDASSADDGLRGLSQSTLLTHKHSLLGLIMKAAMVSDQFTSMIIRHSDGAYVRYLVEGGSIKLVGELAVHSEDIARLFTSAKSLLPLTVIRFERSDGSSDPDAYWSPQGRNSAKSGAVEQPHCPYCDRQFHYTKLIDHLCLAHGHDDATKGARQVQCRLCHLRIVERDLLRHVLTEHIIKSK
jgi:hypothetical protein